MSIPILKHGRTLIVSLQSEPADAEFVARYGLPGMIVRESVASARLQERYFDALETYVGDAEESALLDAYELGRQIMDSAGGVLDLSSVHQDATEAVMRRMTAGRPRELAARRCHEFLDEALSPFEMAQRGFREANMRLMTVNTQLAHQSAQLSAVIASINDGLVVADSDGAVTAANERAAQLLGVRQDAPGADLLLELFPVRGDKEHGIGVTLRDVTGERELGAMRIDRGTVEFSGILDRLATVPDDEACPLAVQAPDDVADVFADPQRILQVLLNLVSNARKYSPDGGQVSVTAAAGPEGAVTVTVADEGLGIEAEAIPRLFGEFYRVQTPDRQGISGTGLGLPICRKIIRAHEGEIWAESDGPGRGTEFRFTLPVADPAEQG